VDRIHVSYSSIHVHSYDVLFDFTWVVYLAIWMNPSINMNWNKDLWK
jgi:hypothetical protein